MRKDNTYASCVNKQNNYTPPSQKGRRCYFLFGVRIPCFHIKKEPLKRGDSFYTESQG